MIETNFSFGVNPGTLPFEPVTAPIMETPCYVELAAMEQCRAHSNSELVRQCGLVVVVGAIVVTTMHIRSAPGQALPVARSEKSCHAWTYLKKHS